MMSDLIERLRRYSYQQGTDDEQGQWIAELVGDMHEAADEIERLHNTHQEALIAVWRALDILQNDKFATRAYNAATCLEDILDSQGYPEL
jgi:hypothetical protein